jgi:uncharacterized protein (DUF362 family)
MTQTIPNVSRREFIKSLSLVAGAAACSHLLAACGPAASETGQPVAPASPAKATQKPPASPQPPASSQSTAGTPSAASPVASAAASPHLAVARNGDPEEMVRRAVAALGGIQRFVPQGATVVVKPNICVAYHTYEYAATTNPWVVAALVKLCLEAGAARVQVLDYPFGGSPQDAYARSGIAEQVQAAGGEMTEMSSFKFIETAIPQGQDLHTAKIYEDVLKADVLIDVPIAKHHGMARLTLGMKNLMGIILERQTIHRNMGQRLADLNTLVRPKLTVIDAVRILMKNGPTGGNLADVKQIDTVIASPDIVAADSYAATLFGLAPDDLAYIRAGAQMGLGRSDLSNLKIEEINVGA